MKAHKKDEQPPQRFDRMTDDQLIRALFGERATEQLKREMREKGLTPESEISQNLPPIDTD